jgi:hypothetical protein
LDAGSDVARGDRVLYYAEMLGNGVWENVSWALLRIGTGGFVLTLAAFTAGRTQGELSLAWAALALAVTFVAGTPFLLFGFGVE